MLVLKECPVCKKIPHIGYCCGEYMVYCNDEKCPIGGTSFTEMHTDSELEIKAWNERVRNALFIETAGW